MLFLSQTAVAELDSVEIEQAQKVIDKYTNFDLSKNLDQWHATWLCIIYYNKHSEISGAAGEAVYVEDRWQCPVRLGYSGKKTGEYIYINSHSLKVSKNGWPTENGQKLLSQAVVELKQELAASAANKSKQQGPSGGTH